MCFPPSLEPPQAERSVTSLDLYAIKLPSCVNTFRFLFFLMFV